MPPTAGGLSSGGAYRSPVTTIKDGFATLAFHLIERILLMLAALMTIGGAVTEIVDIFQTRSIILADIQLMFLDTEVIGMVSVF